MEDERLADFRLVDEHGSSLTLASLDGWLLLYWYPKADTPGCVAQAESLRDNYESFESLGCAVYGASFDPPAAIKAFKDKYHLPFSLLSDQGGEVARSMGAASPESRVASRIAFLVDPDKRIVRRYEVESPSMFAEFVLDDLEALVAETQP